MGVLSVLRLSRRFRRSETGAAMVEMTLLLPFLIVLMLGIFEFGRFLYQYQQVVNGVRDAARWAARVDDPYNDPDLTRARNLATRGDIDGAAGTERVSGWLPGQVTVTETVIDNSANTYRGGATISVVTVSTTWSYNDMGMFDVLASGLAFVGGSNVSAITVTVAHEERHIGE